MARRQAPRIQETDGFIEVVSTGPGRFQASPLMRRRWENFKANKRGYWSLWIISTMVVLSMFAEFIANDSPLVMGYKGTFIGLVLTLVGDITYTFVDPRIDFETRET